MDESVIKERILSDMIQQIRADLTVGREEDGLGLSPYTVAEQDEYITANMDSILQAVQDFYEILDGDIVWENDWIRESLNWLLNIPTV